MKTDIRFLILISSLMIAFLIGCKEDQADVIVEQGEPVILSWDSINSPRIAWSVVVMDSIEDNWSKLSKASDVEAFCPKYKSLDVEKQKKVFGEIIVGMAFFESSWKLNSWMEENMGKDEITGKNLRSEGLMQMSYGDMIWAPFCKFDWNKDKNLNEDDLKKTIFDPKLNLQCAISILANQVNKYGILRVGKGKQYWAVILEGGKYDKTKSIADRVKKFIKECN